MSGKAVNLRAIAVRKTTKARRIARAKRVWDRAMSEAMTARWLDPHDRLDDVGRVIPCSTPPRPGFWRWNVLAYLLMAACAGLVPVALAHGDAQGAIGALVGAIGLAVLFVVTSTD